MKKRKKRKLLPSDLYEQSMKRPLKRYFGSEGILVKLSMKHFREMLKLRNQAHRSLRTEAIEAKRVFNAFKQSLKEIA